MFDYIDLYCERTAPGLWGEPFNALSNLAFLFAAWRLWRAGVWRDGTWDVRLLVLLVASVGIGSGLWHFSALRWAMWADIVPILLFIAVYLLVFLRRIAGLGWPAAAGLFLLFQGVNVLVQASFPPDLFNGSIFYVPTVVMLLLMTAFLKGTRRPEWRLFVAASGLLLLSIGMRSIDIAVCEYLPLGTHFLWHLLNALVLYLLVQGVGGVKATR